MLCRKAVPDDIREEAGDVDKRTRRNTRVVRQGQKADARADACSDDADPAMSGFQQPVGRATCIENSLACRSKRTSDVGGDQEFGAFEVFWFSVMVVRHAQAQ